MSDTPTEPEPIEQVEDGDAELDIEGMGQEPDADSEGGDDG